MNQSAKRTNKLRRTSIALGLVAVASVANAQFQPDPDILDAGKNGGGYGNGQNGNGITINTPNIGTPLGGVIQVVNESDLPPLGQGVDLGNIEQNGNGRMPNGSNQGMSSGGSSSGIPIMGGGGMGGGQSQNMPFPMPQSQSQGGQQGQQGEMPKGQIPPSQSGQAGPSGPMPQIDSLPPPPEEMGVGGDYEGVGVPSEMSPEEEAAASEQGGPQSQSKRSAKNSSKKSSGDNGKESTESDDQEMPGNIGGSQATSRGKGVEEGVKMPSGL